MKAILRVKVTEMILDALDIVRRYPTSLTREIEMRKTNGEMFPDCIGVLRRKVVYKYEKECSYSVYGHSYILGRYGFQFYHCPIIT